MNQETTSFGESDNGSDGLDFQASVRRVPGFDNTAILDLSGDLGLSSINPVRGAIEAALYLGQETDEKHEPVRHLVLNLTNIGFVDSAGLAVIIDTRRFTNDTAAPAALLHLCGLPAQPARVFRLAQIDQYIPIHATEAEALDAIRHFEDEE
jgi:anti-anti-sigma factor